MAKTLIVNNADFSGNALAQVIFSTIPCEGIEFASATLSFTAIEQEKTIAYTLTPVDCTEPVTWVSSNTNIITVSANGVLTSVGIGTCTVTATCGEYTASCTITSTATADFIAVGNARHNHGGKPSNRLSVVNTGSGFVQLGRNDSDELVIGLTTSGAEMDYGSGIRMCPIIIPKNTSTIRVTAPYSNGRFYYTFHNSKSPTTAYETQAAKMSKTAPYSYTAMVQGKTINIPFNDVSAIGEATIDYPEETDSIAITYYSDSCKEISTGTIVEGFFVEFIAA